MKFQIGSVLAGVLSNDRDRSVYYMLDDELVTGNLAPYNGLDELGQPSEPFTAFEVMSGASTSGNVSQSYVTEAVKSSGIRELTPLPREYFHVSQEEKMTIPERSPSGPTRRHFSPTRRRAASPTMLSGSASRAPMPTRSCSPSRSK